MQGTRGGRAARRTRQHGGEVAAVAEGRRAHDAARLACKHKHHYTVLPAAVPPRPRQWLKREAVAALSPIRARGPWLPGLVAANGRASLLAAAAPSPCFSFSKLVLLPCFSKMGAQAVSVRLVRPSLA